jgi:hypothetical protein
VAARGALDRPAGRADGDAVEGHVGGRAGLELDARRPLAQRRLDDDQVALDRHAVADLVDGARRAVGR